MRILRVITRLDVHGGTELSTLVEVEELAARGHHMLVVTVAAPPSVAASERLEAAGADHVHLDGRVPLQAVRLRRLIGKWNPALIHAAIFRAELVVALASIGRTVPTLVSLVNMQYDRPAVASAPSPWRLEVVRRIESLVLQLGFDRYHCVSEAVRTHAVDRLGLDPARTVVAPRGRRRADLAVDGDDVRRVRAQYAPGGTALLLNIGRQEAQKGQNMLIRVVELLVDEGVDVCLVIAGRNGNESARLGEMIIGAGLAGRVQLLGERDDVAILLAAADVVCVASRWEGIAGSVLEALGAGCTIVSFGVPAVREVVGDAGMVIEPFDVEAFAAAVRTAVEDPDSRTAFASAARRRFAERYEMSSAIDQIEFMYVALIGSSEPRVGGG